MTVADLPFVRAFALAYLGPIFITFITIFYLRWNVSQSVLAGLAWMALCMCGYIAGVFG